MENKRLNETTIEELKEYANGAVVELPPFSDSQPFCVRLRRPNATEMLVNGSVPNELMHTAFVLFQLTEEEEKKLSEQEQIENMERTQKMLQHIAKCAMVSPTYQDVLDAGLEMTDAQLIGIYNYVQTGVKKLAFFRKTIEED